MSNIDSCICDLNRKIRTLANALQALAAQVASIDIDDGGLSERLDCLEQFILGGKIYETNSPTIDGIEVSAIQTGNTYNLWGTGAMTTATTLQSGVKYYLADSADFPPLSLYQGDPTICPGYIVNTDGTIKQVLVYFDSTGAYIIGDGETFQPGTKIQFTQPLVLSDGSTSISCDS